MARKQNAGERKAVVEPEDAPLVRGGGTDLDKAGDRDEVEPAARPGKRVQPEQQWKPERGIGSGDDRHKAQQDADAHDRRDQQHAPAFGRASGGEQRARADADHQGYGQETGRRIGQAEFRAPEVIDLEQQQGREEIEERFRPDDKVQRAILAERAQEAEGIDDRRPRERVAASGSRVRGNEGRTHKPPGRDGHGQYRHQPAAEGVSRFDPCLIQRDPGEEHPEQDGRRGPELEQGVDAGDLADGKQFGDGAVERRAEQRGAQAHAEGHGEHPVPVERHHAPRSRQHSREFQRLRADDEAFLGETVGKPAAPCGEEHERQRE